MGLIPDFFWSGSLTLDPSFGHNLYFKCSNEQCELILDIYVSKDFQWYKECHKPWSFDPWNRSLKFQKSTGIPSPKVGVALGVWGFTPSHFLTLTYIPESMWCDSRPYSWPATLQPLCFGHKLKARVATFCVPSTTNSPIKIAIRSELIEEFNHIHCNKTKPQKLGQYAPLQTTSFWNSLNIQAHFLKASQSSATALPIWKQNTQTSVVFNSFPRL
jgi:hypothetical protein